jgi:uncharacterized protein YdaU (DUF1376 family)
MSAQPYMPLWISDFIGDTLELDAKEVGAYMLILMAMWQRGGTLPDDDKKLQRIARVGREWPKVWASIEHYFIRKEDMICNKRLSLEATKCATKRQVNKQLGARGGRAKALKSRDQTLANATNSLEQNPSNHNHNHKEKEDTNVSSKKKATRLSRDWVLPDDWLEWGVSEGWTNQDLLLEADKFKDYWISKSSDARKLDWLAVWRNWLRNSRNLKPKFLQIQGAENGFTDSKSDQRLQAFLGGARRTS